MSENITLTDRERAALEALWRAGESALITAVPDELRNGVVDLYVKELVTFAKDGRKTVVNLTDKGRKLAVDLFTPPLVMPTSEDAVKAWLQARGLWAEGDSIRIDKRFGDLDTIVLQNWLMVEYEYYPQGTYSPTVYKRRISDAVAEAQFRAEFDRACAIARALNANAGEE